MIRGLLRDSAIYGLAAIVSKGLTLVLLFIYGRVLSPEGFGAFELVTTFGVLVALTVPLEVSQGLGRHYAEADGQARVRLLSTAWWFSVAMYLVFFVVTYPMAPVIAENAFGDADLLNACRLGIAFIGLNGLYTFLLNQFRWELQARRYAIVSVGYSATTLAVTALMTLGLRLGLNGALLAQIIAAATASTVSLFLLWRKIRFSFDVPTLRTMLRFSGPLVPAGVAIFSSMYLSRFSLNEFGTLEDVGSFAVAVRLGGMATLLILGVQGALTPLVYEHHNNPETPGNIAKLFSWFCAVALLASLALSLFARDLLAVFTTSSYEVDPAVLGLLAPALLLAQMYIFTPGLAIAKRTGVQLFVVMTSGLVSLAANLALVPVLGGLGAAIATLSASSVMFALWAALSQKYYPIPFSWKRISAALALFLGCLVVGLAFPRNEFGPYVTSIFRGVVTAAFAAGIVAIGLVRVRDLELGFPAASQSAEVRHVQRK